jgi:membrane protein YdbS with pleckstrin-like domain
VAKNRSDKYLLAGEHVDYQTRRHWAILLRPAADAAGALLLLSILFGWTGSNVVTGLGGLFVLFLAARLSWRVSEWRVANLYITDWRLFEISGLVTQRIAAMPLRKITDLTYETTPLGRVLDFGRFIVETAGQDQAFSRLDYIPHANEVYQTLSHLTLHGTATPPASANTQEIDLREVRVGDEEVSADDPTGSSERR